jgi:hypothetical protein
MRALNGWVHGVLSQISKLSWKSVPDTICIDFCLHCVPQQVPHPVTWTCVLPKSERVALESGSKVEMEGARLRS